jgi:hypothetical protein
MTTFIIRGHFIDLEGHLGFVDVTTDNPGTRFDELRKNIINLVVTHMGGPL